MKIQAKPKGQLAALTLAAALALPIIAPPAAATGIPTIDAANLAQAILEVMESIEQTTTLIDSYDTQLRQLENELLHTMAPAAYIWEQANETMSKMEAAQRMLEVYGDRLNGLDKYLDQFKDVNWYKRSPCFSSNGCTEEERQALYDAFDQINTSQKNTNENAITLSLKQLAGEKSARDNLKRIKQQAESAKGQLQATGAGNQISAVQADTLISINSQLSALVQVMTAQAQEAQTRKALESKTAEQFLSTSNIKPSPAKGWLP